MEFRCPECASYLLEDARIGKNVLKIRIVLLFNALMMVGEVTFGYLTGSMALVTEGWHMGSHVGALLITWLAYALARSPQLSRRLSFGGGKLIPLGGYTSAIMLGMVSVLVFVESVSRLLKPAPIAFKEALLIASVGFVVNLLSAFILNHESGYGHAHMHGSHVHSHSHVHDHNIRSAFIHVAADAVVSGLAVGALAVGKLYHWLVFDPLIGIIGAVVILSWALQLCRDAGWELLDGHSKAIDWQALRAEFERDGTKILDFHAWRIAPGALACELVVNAQERRGLEHYREILRERFHVQHIVVEERSGQA